MLKYILSLIFIGFTANAAYINDVTVTNFPATQAVTKSGTWNIDAILNPVAVTGTFWQAVQPVSGSVSVSNFPATQPVSGTVAVSNFPATQAVTGTFWQATQPVSLAAIPLATNAATLSEQQTQTTSLSNIETNTGNLNTKIPSGLTVTAGKLQVEIPSPLAVTGTFWQATQPVSIASIPLATGASTLTEQQTQTTALGNILANVSPLAGATYPNVYDNGPGSGNNGINILSGGMYKDAPPTLFNGDQSELILDNKGNLKVSVENTVPTLNIGGVDVNNWPSLFLTAGTLPSVTRFHKENFTGGAPNDEDFLKIGGFDPTGNNYKMANLDGGRLQVADTLAQSTLASIDTKLSGPVPVVATEPSSVNKYQVAVTLIPTTLTTGLNYFVLRNTSAVKKVKIKGLQYCHFYAGTAGATRSLYDWRIFTGGTATTGTAINITKRDQTSVASAAEVKFLATGLTVTGATFLGNFQSTGHANQLTANMCEFRDFTYPIVLALNEGIVVSSNGAIVAGSTTSVNLQWVEE